MTPARTLVSQIVFGPQNTMTNIKRYPNVHKNRGESVAEHSYCVAVIADNLARDIALRFAEVKIDGMKVLHFALYHDFYEAFTGDLPTWYKYADDRAREAIEKLDALLSKKGMEESFAGNSHIREHIISSVEQYEEHKHTQLENRIVKFADHLQGLAYSLFEVDCGNKQFEEILRNFIEAIIEKYGKSRIFRKYVSDILADERMQNVIAGTRISKKLLEVLQHPITEE